MKASMRGIGILLVFALLALISACSIQPSVYEDVIEPAAFRDTGAQAFVPPTDPMPCEYRRA